LGVLRAGGGWSLIGVCAGLVLLVVPPVGAAVIGLSLAALAICLAGRCAVIVFFFTRYSLRAMVLWVLAANVCMTLLVVPPGGWKLMGIIGLGTLLFSAVFYVVEQDPHGRGLTPPFIAEALRARKLRAIREQREKGRTGR
jgi:hypothetical protein